MSHLPESILGLFALHPAAVPNRTDVERHLRICADCRQVLGEIRSFDERLRSADAWEEQNPRSDAADELRRFAARAADEDRAAEDLLADFRKPEQAARFAWLNIAARAEYQTGGVARLLCKLTNEMCQRKPLYALALAEAAVSISTILPNETYPRNAIHELRGERR